MVPFVLKRETSARVDLRTGRTAYDLTLQVAWETGLPVYRIDAEPRIAKGRDDAGHSITVPAIDSRIPVAGMATQLTVRLEGLQRAAKKIDVLQGNFRATVAERMHDFTFDDLTVATSKKSDGVEVVMRKFEKEGTYWIADLQLRYPPESAVFESFETYWISQNQFTLLDPNGKKFSTDDIEINGHALRYRFKEGAGFKPMNLKGWKLEYVTPGILKEVPIRFELKEIQLP